MVSLVTCSSHGPRAFVRRAIQYQYVFEKTVSFFELRPRFESRSSLQTIRDCDSSGTKTYSKELRLGGNSMDVAKQQSVVELGTHKLACSSATHYIAGDQTQL